MRHSLPIAALIAPLWLGGCVWVPMEPGAREVRVASADEDMAACERRGEVAVTVKDGVAFVSRNPLKVRDELETLARNEAGGLDADTVQPKSEPVDGQQRFLAYHCGTARPTRARSDAERRVESEGDVEVFRIE